MVTREQRIINWIKKYFIDNGSDANAVIGISGGKDSTVVAKLLVEALGPHKVVAVKMPQGVQDDINISNLVIEYLGLPFSNIFEVNIGEACDAMYSALPFHMKDNPIVYTNLPARIRMTTLYAIAANVHGRVANTCNYSEDYVGYSTKYGDNAGDFSILSNYTVREVLDIGKKLEVPELFITKPPADGLCGKTDEENLGFSYEVLDSYLLDGIVPDYNTLEKIEKLHRNSLHKRKSMPICPHWNQDGTQSWEF